MDILGIDYGGKRVGLACAQKEFGVVTPFGVIEKDSETEKVDELVSLIKKEEIKEIVIGMPFSADGKENRNTKRVKEFGEQVKQKADVEVEFVDERFSSQEADSMGGEATRDEKSAMVILQYYLD